MYVCVCLHACMQVCMYMCIVHAYIHGYTHATIPTIHTDAQTHEGNERDKGMREGVRGHIHGACGEEKASQGAQRERGRRQEQGRGRQTEREGDPERDRETEETTIAFAHTEGQERGPVRHVRRRTDPWRRVPRAHCIWAMLAPPHRGPRRLLLAREAVLQQDSPRPQGCRVLER